METASSDIRRRRRLIRLITVSIAAAIATITLKVIAWQMTGSVGLLSDAAESVVNLAAALIALSVILWSTRPPDEEHAYGHEKADYLSAGFEGALILAAAGTIAWVAIDRLINPTGLTDIGIGLTISVAASVINFGAAKMLVKAGKEEGSLTLVADGQHSWQISGPLSAWSQGSPSPGSRDGARSTRSWPSWSRSTSSGPATRSFGSRWAA
jgi:cation diffusion facilitator family transporter